MFAVTLALFLICPSMGALAASPRYTIYFGLGGGKSFLDDGDQFVGASLDQKDQAWMLNFGWYLSENSALEFGYREYGSFGYQVPGSSFPESVDVGANTLSGIHEIRVADKLSLVPRLGLASVNYTQTFPHVSQYEIGGLFGLGVRFAPIDNLAFEVLGESIIYQLDGTWLTQENGQLRAYNDTITQVVTQATAQVLLRF